MTETQNRLVKLLQGAGEQHRILILLELENESRYVNQLVDALRRPQPTVSYHLRILRDADIIVEHKEAGRVRYYLRDSEAVRQLLVFIKRMLSLLSRSEDQ